MDQGLNLRMELRWNSLNLATLNRNVFEVELVRVVCGGETARKICGKYYRQFEIIRRRAMVVLDIGP